MELSSNKKPCNDQQKKRLVAKIGAGGGVGAVILLGGAFAIASAFIVGRKGRDSSVNGRVAKVESDDESDDEEDEELDKKQVQVSSDDKLSSDEVTKEIVEYKVVPLVSSQGFKSDVIDAEKPGEKTLDFISSGEPEKNYFPDGSVVKKENSGFLDDHKLSAELENVEAEKLSDEISSEREDTDSGGRELSSELENVLSEKFSDEILSEKEDTDNGRRDGEHGEDDDDGEVEEMNCEEAAEVTDISPRSGESMEVCCDDECDEESSIALTAIHEALHELRVDEMEEENDHGVEVNIDEGFGGHYGDNGDIWEVNSETHEEKESGLVADSEADQDEGVTTSMLSASERVDIEKLEAKSNISKEVNTEDTKGIVDSDGHVGEGTEMLASNNVEDGKKDCLVPNDSAEERLEVQFKHADDYSAEERLEDQFKNADDDSAEEQKEETCKEADKGEIQDAKSETSEEKESELVAENEADKDEGELTTTMASAQEKVHIGKVEANSDLSKEVDIEDTRETAVSDSHIGDGEGTLFPMSAGSNVENDKKDSHVPNEILGLNEEVMQENSITDEGLEDPYKHVGEDTMLENSINDKSIAEEQKAETCNEAGLVNEADHMFLQTGLHTELDENECSYKNKEENATPESPELGDHDKNVEVLHMAAVLEKEIISPEGIEVTADVDVESSINVKDDISEPFVCQQKDCNDGTEQTIREEAEAESSDMTMESEDEEIGDQINIMATDEDEVDEVDEIDSSELEESSIGTRDSSTESNTEGVWPTHSLQTVQQEVDGKSLEDKLIVTQTGFKNKSSEIEEERDSAFSKKLKHKSYEASNIIKPTENSIKKYVMELTTAMDHPGNAKARMMLIVTLSLLSSYLCSWLFDCSFTKLSLIVFFTMALSRIRSY